MKRLRSWWTKWGLVDLLTLGGGLTLAIGYARYRRGSWDGPLQDLWPNIATEVLGVWLSVRIIGALIVARERRHAVRDTLAGNLNFLLGICQRLAPHYDEYNIRDLANEIAFFEEKKRLKSRTLAKSLTPDERSSVESSFQLAHQVLADSRAAFDALRSARRLREAADAWRTSSPAYSLNESLTHFLDSAADLATLAGAVRTAQDSPAAIDADHQKVAEFCAAVESYVSATGSVALQVSALTQRVADFRRFAWAEE